MLLIVSGCNENQVPQFFFLYDCILKLSCGLLVVSSNLEKTVPTEDERTSSHEILLKLHRRKPYLIALSCRP